MRCFIPFLLLLAGAAQAQNCPPVDAAEQKAREEQCRAAGGEWARFDSAPRIGAEVAGKCAAVKTAFGCFTHVDGGRIVGRVCVD